MKDGVGRFSGNYGIYNAGGGTLSVEKRAKIFANRPVWKSPCCFQLFLT